MSKLMKRRKYVRHIARMGFHRYFAQNKAILDTFYFSDNQLPF